MPQWVSWLGDWVLSLMTSLALGDSAVQWFFHILSFCCNKHPYSMSGGHLSLSQSNTGEWEWPLAATALWSALCLPLVRLKLETLLLLWDFLFYWKKKDSLIVPWSVPLGLPWSRLHHVPMVKASCIFKANVSEETFSLRMGSTAGWCSWTVCTMSLWRRGA